MKKLIAMTGVSPAAGMTTVAANLALAMQRLGRHVVVLDADPRNQVRLHFGMDVLDTDGWWQHSQRHVDFSTAAYEAAAPLDAQRICAHFVPFGSHSRVLEADDAFACLRDNPSAFKSALESLPVADDALVFVTLSEAIAPLHYQVLQSADLVIGVMTPNPLWQLQYTDYVRSLPESETLLAKVLINQCRPEVRLSNDMVQLIQAEISAKNLIPLVCHQDQHVPEALAHQQVVEMYQPQSQFASEMDALALWLTTQVDGHHAP